MSKRILIISSSLRTNSNSDVLAEAFARGAREAGNEVEEVSMKGKTVAFCKGCMACLTTQKCVIRDDAVELAEKMKSIRLRGQSKGCRDGLTALNRHVLPERSLQETSMILGRFRVIRRWRKPMRRGRTYNSGRTQGDARR